LKLLLIDNTFDPPHGSPEIHRHLEKAAKKVGPLEVVVARAPEEKIPLDLSGFDGAVLSGSKTRIAERAPWIEKEIASIRELHRLQIPMLGICYGEQLIALAIAGEKTVGDAPVFEHGWAKIERISPSAIFEGIPAEFCFYEYHKDEARNLPASFRVTARNSACGVQAFEVEGAPIWGLQFHPERALAEGNKSLDTQLAKDPAYPALNRQESAKLYQEQYSEKIFENFLREVKKRAK